MSINEEIDIFSDIVDTPNKGFWEKILHKETQKSTIIGNCPSKKETNSKLLFQERGIALTGEAYP